MMLVLLINWNISKSLKYIPFPCLPTFKFHQMCSETSRSNLINHKHFTTSKLKSNKLNILLTLQYNEI